MSDPCATVILINRNGGEFLRDALRSCRADLERAWDAEPCFELLVVDNGSTDDSPAVIDAELRGAAFPWRVVSEPVAGVNSARNAGLRHARGELLIFVDSDLEFTDGWLQGYLRAAERHPEHDVFAGRVLVGKVEGEVPDWLDLTGPYRRPAIVVQCDYGPRPAVFPLSAGCGPVGPNMAFRRSLFDRVGWFDTRFGLRPGSLVAGAEAEFFDRLAARGHAFVYVPGAAVYHPLKRSQIARDYFLRRLHGIGRVNARLQRLRGDRCRRFCGLTLWVVRRLAAATLTYARTLLRGNPRARFYQRGEIAVLLGHLHEDLLARSPSRAGERGSFISGLRPEDHREVSHA